MNKIGLNQYKTMVGGEVIDYVIYKGHTLGYLFLTDNNLKLGVLHSSTLKGAPFCTHDGVLSLNDLDEIKKATTKDFTEFNVMSKNYDLS